MLWSTKCDSSVAFLSFPDHTAAYGKPKCSAFPSSDWIFRNGEQLIASTVVLPIPMLLPLWISFWRSYRRLIYPTEFILTAALRKYGFSGINTLLMQLTEICTTYFMFVIQRRPKTNRSISTIDNGQSMPPYHVLPGFGLLPSVEKLAQLPDTAVQGIA